MRPLQVSKQEILSQVCERGGEDIEDMRPLQVSKVEILSQTYKIDQRAEGAGFGPASAEAHLLSKQAP